MDPKRTFRVHCHCGKVRGRFSCNAVRVLAIDCNCSDCYMRQNIHIIIPADDLSLEMTESELLEATTLYQWGTKQAVRRFCSTCGVLPWYTPRSNPDGRGIKIHCVDWGEEKPEIEIQKFDGVHWEESFKASTLSALSKKS